jgi:hypothetical protein
MNEDWPAFIARGRDASPKRGKLSVECVDWRPLSKGTLLGFAQIRIPEIALLIHDVALHRKNESVWVQLPSKSWIKDGAIVRDADGKPKFLPVVEFDRTEVRAAFSERVIAAVRGRFPDAEAREKAT